MTAQGTLRLREKICYGVGDLAANLYWNTFQTYLLFFYTDVFGIPAAAAGTVCLVAWLLDGAMNPVMGVIADRTETRWGKYRPYLLWVSVPLTIMGLLTFTTPHFAPEGKLVWAYATYVPVMILFAAFTVPYSAMLGVISPDPGERTSLVSIKFVCAYAGAMIVAGSLLPMARALGGGNLARGWQLSFVTYGIAYLVIICFTFFGTRERLRPIPRGKTSVKDDLRDLMSNRPWIILALMTITFILASGIRTTITAYYFKYFVGSQSVLLPFSGGPRTYSFVELVSAYNSTGMIASILGVMLLNWFTRPIGKKRAIGILATTTIVSSAVFFVLKPDQLTAMFACTFLWGLSSAPLFALLWSMFADAADYSEWRTGRRATGLVFAASLMCTKIGGALYSAATGWLLAGVGFQPNVAETPQVLHGLVLLMSLIPAAIAVVYLVLVFYYPLNEKRLAEIESDLHVRRASTPAAATGG
jgi:GPH family glycoside/pentoside/hexuronide:cation symporter